jgi:alkylhydroperoxidase/carboxymuconolactone decarboxylase family protein YurZ
MSEMPLRDGPGTLDPGDILRRLPEAEHDSFLAEYHAALDAAHEVWRYRQLQEVLTQWNLVAIATSQPGYAEALAEARNAASLGVTIDEITARRAAR